MTRILLISGSTSQGSLHTAALRTAAWYAPPEIGAMLFDGLRDLPAFVAGQRPAPGAVTLLRTQINAADAVLISTPEFAGSMPGSLKNLLDWLVDGGELTGKPVAWLSLALPGQDEAALATLETVLEHAAARLLRPACIRIPVDINTVDPQGLSNDPQLHQALQDALNALTRALQAPQQREQPSWQTYSSVFPVIQSQNQSHPQVTRWRGTGS
jgi:chromate reductase, NAD(P)H dehydrogenase (quinone)